MTTLQKLDCGLALTNAAVAKKQNTLAIYLDKNTVTSDSWTKLNVKKGDESRHEIRCGLCGTKKRHAVLLRESHDLILHRERGCINHTGRLGLEEVVKLRKSLLLRHLGKVHILHLTDDLQSRLLVIIVESNDLQTGSVNSAASNINILGKVGKIQCFQRKLLYNLLQFYRIKLFHW